MILTCAIFLFGRMTANDKQTHVHHLHGFHCSVLLKKNFLKK